MSTAKHIFFKTVLSIFAVSCLGHGAENPMASELSTQVDHQAQQPKPFDFLKVPRDNAVIYGFNLRLFIRPKQFVRTSFVLVKGPPFPKKSNKPTYRQTVIVPHVLRRIVSPCLRSICSARITVTSPRFLRYKTVREAHRKITRISGFISIYNTQSKQFRIIRKGKKKFIVIIPFQVRYLEERRDEIREL